ncbi:MAG: Co2+/Mg2+ efflux protein ApaG [Lysobacteraceae bacterium]
MDNAHRIDIQVSTRYLEEQSAPEAQRYVFAYTIRIRNSGQAPAQLVSRHWIITHATGKVEEVRGEGVVGQQPWLRPGEAFEYSSGAVLESAVGTMHGSYRMQADDGIAFDAAIAPFTLAVPRTLH